MKLLRTFAALSGFANRIYFILGAGFIFLLLSMMPAYADGEATPPVQDVILVSTSDSSTATLTPVSSSSTDTSSASATQPTQQQNLATSGTSPQPETPTVTSIETKIENATLTRTTAVESATTVVQAIPSVQAVVAASPVATQAVESSTVAVTAATVAIQAADSATATAVVAQQAVESQTAVVATATVVVESATAVVATTTAAVESQTAVVVQETSELTNLQNTPSDTKTYTTEGYVAPVAPETPTVTTVTLPTMYDGFTKINTPFDIKLGNTVYEGQGTNSQIYVTSKATITFGVGDYNWSDFPAGPSISVFGSDFMSSNANGSFTTVTTTETTLEVDWNLKRFQDVNGPLTNVNWKMTVNPTTGEWTGVGTVAGNTTQLYNGPRIGVRETMRMHSFMPR